MSALGGEADIPNRRSDVVVLQPYVVVATMVSVLVAAIAWFAFRARKKGEPPIITASS
jgi:hypothetical protein